MNNKGFTLVEVLAVIAIIAVVGLIAVPNVIGTLNNSKKASNKVLYENIKTGLQTMYEEIDYAGEDFYQYDNSGKTGNKIIITTDGEIVINVQSLVSNGFLMGINNENTTNNENKKIVLDASNKDIGMCVVTIKKVKNDNKVSYKYSGSDVDGCPTTGDLEG